MTDSAHRLTDERLEEMEKHLSGIYSRAVAEIQKTADEYFSKFAKQDEAKRRLLDLGEIDEDEYKAWRKGKLMYGKRFAQMKEQCAQQILRVNETAMAYVNGQLPEIYSLNYNAVSGDVDGVGGYSFSLTDADTVRNLATSDKSLLPYREIDPSKDIPWNTKQINAEVLQGILQGESMDKIAGRMAKVVGMDETAAIRNARTMVTSAECKGRQDSYIRAQNDGIIMQRRWIAAKDARTRHWHAELDGTLAAVDEPFSNSVGLIMYPGDPGAHPANVYNCRCTIAAKVLGFRRLSDGHVSMISDPTEQTERLAAQDWWQKARASKEFDTQQKMLYNKRADKAQYSAYKARLGKDAPSSFKAFQELKYHDPVKYSEIKEYYRYKGHVPDATADDFAKVQKIKDLGVIGTIRVPAQRIDVSNLSAYNEHAFHHGCTIEDAKRYIDDSNVSITRRRWDGLSINFYSDSGAAYVDSETKKVKTIFSGKDFDPITDKMMEVFK